MPFDNLPGEVSNATAEAIARAIELLETKGWCRDYLEDAAGRRCLIGALAGNDAYARLAPEVVMVARRALPLPFRLARPALWSLLWWNDAPWRTKGAVLRLLHRAHRRAVRGGQHAI
jgi:hypothetical protein